MVWWLKCVNGYWLALDAQDFQGWLEALRAEPVGRLHGVVLAFGVIA